MNIKISCVLIFLVLIFPFCDNAIAKDGQGNFIVVLDAGHGGRDEGVKISRDLSEKELTLNFVVALKKNLDRSENIRAFLTRSSDRDLSETERLRQASAEQIDLLIRLHVNAGFDKNSSGFEMYYPGFKNTATGRNDSKEIVKDMVSNKALNESVRFSKILQSNLDDLFPRKDRGLREGPVNTQSLTVPALLLEIGFATNPKDRKSLQDADVQKKIVEALELSIREYFNKI
jgi:N-acetylmuramoyl-L-alanine amidase